MTVAVEAPYRPWPQKSSSGMALEDKYEVMKEIGDGSFGSVVLARVRGAGAHIARRGTLVAIKTMKKTFNSFSQCLELREVVFMRSLPAHPHIVPALDIFLDPISNKLHIAMEHMDGNLYQLMKAREHKLFDTSSVKSMLFQILSGLEHIHEHDFFHRDIKPENILVSTSALQDNSTTFRRYSALVTPPSTPPAYTIKLADFGLARETASKQPYTTYVSTRWYRAPEVLLRAGSYSAPVDIWAVGAMAAEIATLKPLFPGVNEVDQVWRVCEIMGSPGSWLNKRGAPVGGGEWKDGIRLAYKLGFSFPKMAPHSLKTILQTTQWPAALSDLITWCLLWDPNNRPTSTQALQHEYFADAVDPSRPKSSRTILSRKKSDVGASNKEPTDSVQSLSSRTSSWFRKSMVTRESAPAVPKAAPVAVQLSPKLTPDTTPNPEAIKNRPPVNKRATWANGLQLNGAPMPILPSIRPISPLSDTVNAQAQPRQAENDSKAGKKIGRQLSVASHGNHYTDAHREEAERTLNGQDGLVWLPQSGHKESFFSHLRKRARRLSARHQIPLSPTSAEMDANAGCVPWSNRQSMIVDSPTHVSAPAPAVVPSQEDFTELDKALQGVKHSLQEASPHAVKQTSSRILGGPFLKRNQSQPGIQITEPTRDVLPSSLPSLPSNNSPAGNGNYMSTTATTPRNRRSTTKPIHPAQRYETPDEQEELLNDGLISADEGTKYVSRNPSTNRAAASLPTPKEDCASPVKSVNLKDSYESTYQQQPGHNQYHYQQQNMQQRHQQQYQQYQHYQQQSHPAYISPVSTVNRESLIFADSSPNRLTKPASGLMGKALSSVKTAPLGTENHAPKWPTPPYEENDWAAAAAASIFAVEAAYR